MAERYEGLPRAEATQEQASDVLHGALKDHCTRRLTEQLRTCCTVPGSTENADPVTLAEVFHGY
jgi:hypothetical protein